ncbi:unnamed protein product [Mesocestoides corti]|uniref:Uncharacterized protein n=2 Tax=Mesocestoides corti TaxID=53468 RepID=A0A0R3UIH2_MESCO|nr:unnamed protein product [Mesocestoides corti]
MKRQAAAEERKGGMSQMSNAVCVNRRQSVLPTTSPMSTELAPRNGSFERTLHTANRFRKPSPSVGNFRRVSNLLKAQGPTEALKSALGNPNRTRFMQLCSEYESLAAEWRRIYQFLQKLMQEYIESKSLDPVRRYRKLQSITKRIVFHLRLTNPSLLLTNGYSLVDDETGSFGSILQSSVKLKEMRMRHETICDRLSSEELVVEIRKLERINSELEEKIQTVVEAIDNMDDEYQCTKNNAFIKRYLVLKCNLKVIFEGDFLH